MKNINIPVRISVWKPFDKTNYEMRDNKGACLLVTKNSDLAVAIMHALNSHDALVTALRDALDALRVVQPEAWALTQGDTVLTNEPLP